MVFAAGGGFKAERDRIYSEKRRYLEDTLKKENLKLTDKARSLESKTSNWQDASALSLLAVFSSFPVSTYIFVQGFGPNGNPLPDQQTWARYAIAYVFGTIVSHFISRSMSDYYEECQIKELENIVSKD